jgi:hypothetical protein
MIRASTNYTDASYVLIENVTLYQVIVGAYVCSQQASLVVSLIIRAIASG